MVKCANHPRKDALAICRSCGNGVCSECQQKIGGLSYCLSCIDEGRYQPPSQTTALASSDRQVLQGFFTPFMRYAFLIGIFAMALLSLGFYLLFFSSLLPNIRVVAMLLIASSISLGSVPFYSYWRAFFSKLALGVALFSSYAGWPVLIANILALTGQVYSPGSYPWELYPGPLFTIYVILSIIGETLLGITFILWAIVLIRNRKYLQSQILVLAAGIFFMMIGHYMLIYIPFLVVFVIDPYFYIGFLGFSEFILACIAETAAVLTAISFYHLRKQAQMTISSKFPTHST